MPSLLAIGSAALDVKARLVRAPLPTTDVPGQITLKPGGVARNIAEDLARLGVPIVFAGIMGDDPQARLLIELSRAAGLSVRPLTRSPPAPDDLYRLKLENAAVRRRALSLLDVAGDRTVAPRAFELLHDPDLDTRTAALAYLAHQADVDPLSAIQSLGDFAQCSVRAGLVSFLARPGRSQNLEAARVLFDAMVAEPDPEGRATRLEAARLTGVLPSGFGRAIGRLVRDPDVEVGRAAIRAVGAKKRAEFVPELIARLGHPQLADDAERSLGALGDDTTRGIQAPVRTPPPVDKPGR